MTNRLSRLRSAAPTPCEPAERRSVPLTHNYSANNTFPTAATAQLRLGHVAPLAQIEVVIVAPFRRTVRGRANETGNRVYLDQGWEANDGEGGWPERVEFVRASVVREGRRAMRDAEFDRLQDAYDALFGGKVYVWRNGRKEAMEIPAFRKEGPIARKEAMKIVRRHLSHRLHGICRDCETEDPEFYMTSRELWEKALAGTYTTGWLCLRCLAKRLEPRQLFAEDLSNGSDGLGSLPFSNDWEWTDPANGATFQMKYQISFPSREGPPELRCTMDFFSDGDEPPDAFLGGCDDRVAWLWDYCREHGLDLVINDNIVLQRGEEIEG